MRKPWLIFVAAGGAVLAFGVGIAFIGPLLWPNQLTDTRPALEPVPPLEPISRVSVVVAPATVSLTAIRDALEAAAPRTLAGKPDNPLPQVLAKADINWSVERGAITVAGQSGALSASTPFAGLFHVTGQLGGQVGKLSGALGNLISGNLGQQIQSLAGKTFDQSADLRGAVTVAARPALTTAWRLDPNLSAQVDLGNSALSMSELRINVPNEVKPYIDRSVSNEVAALQERIRADPFVEMAARREWAKLCRSIPLAAAGAASAGAVSAGAVSAGAVSAGMPNLWLEVRPVRAFAAQPTVDADAVNLQVGVQAETRVMPEETKPECPFPAQLQIVPKLREGQVHVAVPIDIPFAEVNRLLEAELKDHAFPDLGSGASAVTIRSIAVAPSGPRLLISLGVNVREKGFLKFGTDVKVHIWGRPQLDKEQQTIRLTDIAFDVDSEAAFGLLGGVAKAAAPYLREVLAEKAVLDLKPFAAQARKRIAASVAALSGGENSGVHVGASVSELRLVGIDYDANTLRLISEADGTVDVAVTALPLP